MSVKWDQNLAYIKRKWAGILDPQLPHSSGRSSPEGVINKIEVAFTASLFEDLNLEFQHEVRYFGSLQGRAYFTQLFCKLDFMNFLADLFHWRHTTPVDVASSAVLQYSQKLINRRNVNGDHLHDVCRWAGAWVWKVWELPLTAQNVTVPSIKSPLIAGLTMEESLNRHLIEHEGFFPIDMSNQQQQLVQQPNFQQQQQLIQQPNLQQQQRLVQQPDFQQPSFHQHQQLVKQPGFHQHQQRQRQQQQQQRQEPPQRQEQRHRQQHQQRQQQQQRPQQQQQQRQGTQGQSFDFSQDHLASLLGVQIKSNQWWLDQQKNG